MRRTLIFFVWIIVLIQFIRVDYTNPPLKEKNDLIVLTNPPENVQVILKKTCYNCHSNTTVWPWYSQIAPASWLITHDVNEARRHFNFSKWNEMDTRHIEKFVEEAEYEILEGDMPLPSFTIMHKNTKLTDEEKEIMIDWLSSL
jgi:hypothetical protein